MAKFLEDPEAASEAYTMLYYLIEKAHREIAAAERLMQHLRLPVRNRGGRPSKRKDDHELHHDFVNAVLDLGGDFGRDADRQRAYTRVARLRDMSGVERFTLRVRILRGRDFCTCDNCAECRPDAPRTV
ncbi:MAG: hypothetical protein WA208_21820 [Thermoanaerobaculia bacterium]